MSKKCIVEIDGASKGNPGRSGAGVVIRNEDGRVASRVREGLGHATNNEAEYGALKRGLETALRQGYTDVVVKTDSELVKNQVQGNWKTKNPIMHEFCNQAKGLKDQFRSFDIEHVNRGFNYDADAQASRAAKLPPGVVQYDHEDVYYDDSDDDYY